jgi:hypothetical protein
MFTCLIRVADARGHADDGTARRHAATTLTSAAMTPVRPGSPTMEAAPVSGDAT